MECVEMRYAFKDGNRTAKEITLCIKDQNDDGLHDYEICEMFMDLMESAGFSKANILNYFRT